MLLILADCFVVCDSMCDESLLMNTDCAKYLLLGNSKSLASDVHRVTGICVIKRKKMTDFKDSKGNSSSLTGLFSVHVIPELLKYVTKLVEIQLRMLKAFFRH